MKKSRIIVPALAMLTLSVAASVTGTVAWFTASRTASMTLKNLVAFSTSGALKMTLSSEHGNASVNNDTKVVTLNAMRDFSYDVNSGKGYIATLDSDGSKVTGTREVSNINAMFGTFGNGVDVYYANTFDATFSTSANVASYLFFNNNIDKSHLSKNYSENNKETPADETKSVYRALRVSMKATDTRAREQAETKIVTWAPYTGASTVLNVNRAATLTTPVDIGLAASTDNYKDGTGAVVTETVNVQKAEGVDPVTEAHTQEFADNSGLLLSNVLVGGDKSVSVKVSFVIWFEGLDPICLSNSLDVATIAANSTAETISMGFYAIESNAFAG